MNKHCKNLLLVASLFGAGGIIMASVGAHAAYETLTTNRLLETFNKAVDYSLYNAIALIAVGLLCQVFSAFKNTNRFHWAGYSIALGGFIFQASLFMYALAGIKGLSLITPIGGILMIIGWIMIGAFALMTARDINQ